MGNVGKMWENRIIEQQRSDKNYRTTKKVSVQRPPTPLFYITLRFEGFLGHMSVHN